MSERLTDHDMKIEKSIISDTQTWTKPDLVTSAKVAKPLQPIIQERLDAYNALTIGEAIELAKSRRGESKKEIGRLVALMEKKGVTLKMKVGEARALAK